MADALPGAPPATTCEMLFGIGTPDATGRCPRAAGARLAGTLLLVVLRAVATIAALAGVGAALSLRGKLSADVQRFLAALSMNVTIPALLFHAAATTVSPALLARAWPLALLPFVYVPLGVVLGSLVILLVRPPPGVHGAVRAACALGNSTGMPVVLLTVVADALVAPAARIAYGAELQPLTYLPLYLLTYPLLQWSVGGALFGLHGAPLAPATPRSQQLRPWAGPAEAMTAAEEEEMEAAGAPAMDEERTGLLLPALSPSSSSSSFSGGGVGAGAALAFKARLRELLAAARAGLLPQLASPPVLASLAGAVVGLLPRKMGALALLSAAASPLGWVMGAAQLLGAAAVPVNLLLLGASLASSAGPATGGPAALLAAAGGAHTAAAVVAAKLVLMPLAAAAFCAVFRRAAPRIAEPYDDSVALVALLVAATPTANNVLVMALAAGGAGGEEARQAVSAYLVAQYAAAPLLLTLSVTTALAVIAARV